MDFPKVKATHLLLCLLFVFLVGQPPSVLAANPLRAAAEPDYPPLSQLDDQGNATGFAVELLREVGQSVGREMNFRVNNWSVIKQKLATEQLDVLPLVARTPDREGLFDFTVPYLSLNGTIVVKRGDRTIFSAADMRDRKIAVMAGDSAEEYVRAEDLTRSLVKTQTYKDALELLDKGLVDAVVIQRLVAEQLISELGLAELELRSNLHSFRQDFCFAVTKGDQETLALLNEGLSKIVSDGTYERLKEKWLGSEAQDRFLLSPDKYQLSDSEKKWIAENPVVSFTGDPNWLPYEAFQQDGTYIGIVADHLKLIEQRTGLLFRPVSVDTWTESLRIATEGRVAVISGDAADAILNQRFNPVATYNRNPIVIIMNSQQNYVEDLEQIKDARIAIIKDYGYTADIYKRYPDYEFVEVENIQQGLEGVSQGRFDAMLSTMALASYTKAEMGLHDIKVVGKTPIIMDLTLFVAKDLPVLHSIIDKTLKSISRAESQAIMQTWGSGKYIEKTNYALVIQIVSVLLVIMVLVLLWNRRLQGEIDRRCKAERQLKNSRSMLEEAQTMAHVGNWELDPVTLKATWSDEIYRMFGIEYTEDVGPEKLSSLLHPEDREQVLDSLMCVVSEGTRHHVEYRVVRPDGETRWLECQAQQVKDVFENISSVRGVIQDITQRKTDELNLRESEARFKALAEAGFEAIFISEQGICISQNLAAEKMFGYTLDEAIGRPGVEWIAPESRDLVADNIRTEYEGCYEATAQRKDGTHFPAEIRGRMIKYDDRTVRVTALLDITDRKMVEDRLRKSEEKYRLLAENVSDVVWVRDLDLNLTYISPSIETISDFTVEEKMSQGLEESMTPESLAEMHFIYEQEISREMSGTADPDRSATINFEMYRKDGTTYFSECVVSFLRDKAGKAIGVIGINRDITERIKAQEARRQSEEKYRTLVESSPYCIHQIDFEGDFLSMNRAGLQMINSDDEKDIIGVPYLKMVSETDRQRIAGLMQDAYAGVSRDFEFRSKGGQVFSSNFVPIFDKAGKVDRLLGITADITLRKQSEQALLKLSRAVEASSCSVIITDTQGDIEYVNPKFSEITGYQREEVYGRNPRFLQSGQSPESVYADLWGTINRGGEWKGEFYNRRKDGRLYWARNSISCVKDSNGEITHFICIQDDVTHEYELSEKLSYQASHDVLTGLINRREFERRVERLLSSVRQEQSHHALCFMDLDQFKVVNDTCGHTAGDEMLRQVGALLQDTVRQRDTLARLGGDEFGVLMEHCSLHDAHRAATAVLQALQDYQFSWEGYSFKIGVSIGLVSLDDVSLTITDLLKNADAACYVAKDLGRNRIHVYDSEDSGIAQRHGEMQWVNRINRALEEDRFCLYAQVIESLGGHSEEHYELLVRMLDDDGKIIPPGSFLPAAERYNLVSKLDRWVINASFAFLESEPEWLEALGSIAINLSGQSLAEADFQEFVINKVRESEIPPDKICFEITETAAITSLSAATVFLSSMKRLGCRFALDDFGSGLSSFGYLKNLEVDYLKIDGIFVKDIVDDPIDHAMVKSINEIGQVMGMQTIAEFVENDEIKDMLGQIGVNYVQGYGIGKPVPVESLIPIFSE